MFINVNKLVIKLVGGSISLSIFFMDGNQFSFMYEKNM
jgi:hypothetical protein